MAFETGGAVPKIVDHNARRQDLLKAALHVVTSEGFDAASVRRVAQQSGCSPGALRYYFPRHWELLEAVIDHVTSVAATRLIPRLRALAGAGPTEVIDVGCALLEELMPLDEVRKSEWAVWIALTERPVSSANVRRWRDAGWAGTRHHCRHVLQRLIDPTAPTQQPVSEHIPDSAEILARVSTLTPLTDPVAEARAAALHTLLDGLSAQTIAFPSEMPADRARQVLRQAVTDIARQAHPGN